ncbi:MAG: NAD-dependent epimerase/dehydratase family protein [Bacteroidota bacterium]
MAKKIIITGANGFIGSNLASFFSARGWSVVGLVRTMPEKTLPGIMYVKYDLLQEPDQGAFGEACCLIHCAYIRNDIEHNIAGTVRLLDASRKHGLKQNIFLSSFSAHPDAVSKYGRQKLELEGYFKGAGDCIVRAGVVLGHGGLFGEMSGHIRKGKRIPLIDGGRQPMQTIHIDDLCSIIYKIADERLSGLYTLAEPSPVSYRQFFTAFCHTTGIKPKFVHVPFFLLDTALRIAEFFRIRLPIARENVLGLKFMGARETEKDLQRLGVRVRSWKESLKLLSQQKN